MWHKVVLAALVLAFTASGAGLASAHGFHGYHHGYGYYNDGYTGTDIYSALAPEKQKQYDAILNDFSQKTQNLRDQLRTKQIELETLGNSTNPNPEAVAKAAQEMVKLQNEWNKEQSTFAERLSKELGIESGRAPYGQYDAGYGYGPCPMNNGFGHRYHRGCGCYPGF